MAILINTEGAAREGLFRAVVTTRSPTAELDENGIVLPELHKESDGQK